ncbi:methylenetetrahydrofolate reductase [Shigella flexneri]
MRTARITSFFFDVGSYLRFRDRRADRRHRRGNYSGILPVSNFKQAKKFADMTNVRIPSWMSQMFNGLDDDAESASGGREDRHGYGEELSREGVKHFDFYLNRAGTSYAICHTLGVRPGL